MNDLVMHQYSISKSFISQNLISRNFISRSFTLLMGVVILAWGVVFSIRSNLGTSPVSSVPFAYSYIIPLSVGTLTVLFHTIMIFMQYLVLKKDFHWTRWLQILVGAAMGIFIDLILMLTANWQAHHYLTQFIFCLFSCILTAIGVCLILKANLVNLAIEGFYQAISLRFKISFSRCKTIGDIGMVSLAILSALICTQNIIGVREGTIITALLVGTIVKWIMPYFSFLDRLYKPT